MHLQTQTTLTSTSTTTATTILLLLLLLHTVSHLSTLIYFIIIGGRAATLILLLYTTIYTRKGCCWSGSYEHTAESEDVEAGVELIPVLVLSVLVLVLVGASGMITEVT